MANAALRTARRIAFVRHRTARGRFHSGEAEYVLLVALLKILDRFGTVKRQGELVSFPTAQNQSAAPSEPETSVDS
jgi:hypothetical protein